MSDGKRRFDFPDFTNLGGFGSKRARSSTNRRPNEHASPSDLSLRQLKEEEAKARRIRYATAKVKAVTSVFKKSLKVIKEGCGLFTPLIEAAEKLQEALDAIAGENGAESECHDIASDLPRWASALVVFLDKNQPIRMSDQVEHLINELRRTADQLSTRNQSGLSRLEKCELNMEELERCYKQVKGALEKLLVEASLNTWKNSDNELKKSLLNGMLPALDALYDSSYADKIERGCCLENTRVAVLEKIRNWIYSSTETKIYWINGMAGTGKTTIAYSVCEELARCKRLGASFFVSRSSSQCQDVNRMLPTIAYQLAQISYTYQSALCRILDQEVNVGQRQLSVQFNHLIESPLQEVADGALDGLVVVIDALDECADPRTTGIMLNTLLQHASKLPVRFFLTSRPDPSVADTILSRSCGSRSILHLHNVEEQLVKADIKTYLTVSLAQLYPTEDQLEQLALQAGVLFIYAATLVRYVLTTGFGTSSKARLEAIIASNTSQVTKKDRAIDRLYREILEGVLQHEEREEHEVKTIELVLWTITCVREPVTKRTLAKLAEVGEDQVIEALKLLQSVIHVSEASDIVSSLHASFPEFVLDPLRSMGLSYDRLSFDQYLATRCFMIMEEQLKFNICGLRSSYELDENVPDFDTRVQSAISPELFYACRFWAEHLTRAAIYDAHMRHLDTFINFQLLFWMEVLNLKDWITNGPSVLMEAQTWQMHQVDQRRRDLLGDALELVTNFAMNPIRSSTPHIYLSLLPLMPRQNKIRQCYLERTRGLVTLETTISSANPMGAAPVERINSITFSPDGTKIAAGSNDSKIYIWDYHSCSTVIGSLETGLGPVEIVVFSPDGLWLASSSNSKDQGMLQIWNPRNGDLVLGPIAAHGSESVISSVAFSPGGANIAFAEIPKYHTTTDWPALTVLDMHNGITLRRSALPYPAQSIVYSSDGSFILSKLPNGIIHTWDPYTGVTHDTGINLADTWHPDTKRLLSTPMQDINVRIERHLSIGSSGHQYVTSGLMVSSPQEDYIMCGYRDGSEGNTGMRLSGRTISLWDTRSNRLLFGPFGLKDEDIATFAFSPDGTHVISGSECRYLASGNHCAVRCWDLYQDPDISAKSPYHINIDGWLLDQYTRPIIWVPEELRNSFPFPPNNLVINQIGGIRVSMTNILLGESWMECYTIPGVPPHFEPSQEVRTMVRSI